MKILITDVDEVLLSWSESFDQFIRDEYGYNGVYIAESPQRLWELINVPKENIGEVMAKHAKLSRFGQLNYHNDAEILNHEENFSKFDKIIAITSCGTDPYIQEMRNKNLAQKFPNIIDEVIYLDFLTQKKNVLNKLVHQNPEAQFYMIDDNVEDIRSAIKMGINGFVYKTSFQDAQGLPVVENLSEFFKKIK